MPVSPIAISLSPNVEADDVSLAWHTLTHPSSWHDKKANQEAAEILHRFLGNAFITLTSSGRSALEMILKALKLTAGDEVIIQAFTCIAVPEPIIWRKLKPVYADILPRQYTIDPDDVRRKITSRTRAIIAQHTFGIPADMASLRQIADEHNLVLIEDCAHALGSTHAGAPVGTLSDVAFFSFGRDKSFSSVYGGAIATKKHGLMQALQADANGRPSAPPAWVAQQLLHPLLFSLFLPLYGHLSLGQSLVRISQSIGLLSKAVLAEEKVGRRPSHIKYQYSPALASLVVNQLRKIDRFTRRRHEIGHEYMQKLASFEFNLPNIPQTDSPAWLRFPLLIRNRQEFLALSRKRRMYLGDWYDAPLVPANSNLIAFQYTPGTCPQAEHAAAHIINLPTHIRLSDEQVNQVIQFTINHGRPYYETL